jgi:hypothetical protein
MQVGDLVEMKSHWKKFHGDRCNWTPICPGLIVNIYEEGCDELWEGVNETMIEVLCSDGSDTGLDVWSEEEFQLVQACKSILT